MSDGGHRPETEPERGQDLLTSLRRLSDADLVARVKSLVARERRATALLVAHLAELDTRDVHLREGYSSLFVYCRDALSLSEHEAYNRIEVARAARRYPVILEMLAASAVNLTTVRLLGPYLTPENHRRVLESARGKRKAEVEEIVARLAPFPEAPAFVRKLPAPRPALPAALSAAAPVAPLAAPGAFPSAAASASLTSVSPGASADTTPSAGTASATAGPCPSEGAGPSAGSLPSAVALPSGVAGPSAMARPSAVADPSAPPRPTWPFPASRPSGEITPLAPDRYKLQCTIDGSTLEKLRLAKDMLRHAIPSGDDAAILDRAFTALLADLARSKFAATERPAEKAGASRATAPGSRHVPADVKRAVWVRDLGRCAFVGADGRRCNERAFVEFHHVRPYAVGGEASIENIQLRCRRHNDYEARTYFAPERDAVPGVGGTVRDGRPARAGEPARAGVPAREFVSGVSGPARAGASGVSGTARASVSGRANGGGGFVREPGGRHAAEIHRTQAEPSWGLPVRIGVQNDQPERTNSFQNEFE